MTGPARSGKSEWAETLATECKQPVVYIATAQNDPTDAEWQAKIQAHQQRRPTSWSTIHAPFNLAEAMLQVPASSCLLIDSLGSWMANLLEQDELTWEATVQTLLKCLVRSPNTIILVAEETGWGIVPAYPSGRMFRDRLGNLVRRIGAIADEVYLVTAGYALNLKVLGKPLNLLEPANDT